MLVEIPSCRRCCCCMPLRRGILTFGYLNLLLTLLFGTLELLLCIIYFNDWKQHVGMFRGVVMEVHVFFLIALHVLDVVFNIILIVGAHTKNLKLMELYYFYQMTTIVASMFVLIVTYSHTNKNWIVVLSELAVAFLGFVVQIYLLLLIHNELHKHRYQGGRSSFVNQISEVCLEPGVRQYDRTLF